jgi:hypothetical protein
MCLAHRVIDMNLASSLNLNSLLVTPSEIFWLFLSFIATPWFLAEG